MKVDIRGKYVPIRTIKTQDEWEKVIEAFGALGAVEWEGRKGKATLDYDYYWSNWSFIGISGDVEVVHYDREVSYSGEGYTAIEISKEYLFSLVEGGGVIECADKTGVSVSDVLQKLRLEVVEVINILAMCGDQIPVDQVGKKLAAALNASAPSHSQQNVKE